MWVLDVDGGEVSVRRTAETSKKGGNKATRGEIR